MGPHPFLCKLLIGAAVSAVAKEGASIVGGEQQIVSLIYSADEVDSVADEIRSASRTDVGADEQKSNASGAKLRDPSTSAWLSAGGDAVTVVVATDGGVDETIEIHAEWLRERCQGVASVDQNTLQLLRNPHEYVTPRLAAASLRGGVLEVRFTDGHESVFEVEALAAEFNWQLGGAEREHLLQVKEASLPEVRLWDRNLTLPPVFEYEPIEAGDEATWHQLYGQLLSVGVVLIKNVPQQEGECSLMSSRLSTLRTTEWGTQFNVRARPDAQQAAPAAGASTSDSGAGVKQDIACVRVRCHLFVRVVGSRRRACWVARAVVVAGLSLTRCRLFVRAVGSRRRARWVARAVVVAGLSLTRDTTYDARHTRHPPAHAGTRGRQSACTRTTRTATRRQTTSCSMRSTTARVGATTRRRVRAAR